MTAQPLRNDDTYILPETNIINLDGLRAPVETPAAVLANPDLIAPAKKAPGRPVGSKSKPKKAKRAKKAKAPAATVEPVPEEAQVPDPLRLVAPGGQWLSRVRRIKADTWLVIAAIAAALLLGTAIAVVLVSPPTFVG